MYLFITFRYKIRLKMKRLFFQILYTLFLISLIGCQTVSKKIEDTTVQEEKELSKWLNKTEEDLKSFYGQPWLNRYANRYCR